MNEKPGLEPGFFCSTSCRLTAHSFLTHFVYARSSSKRVVARNTEYARAIPPYELVAAIHEK
jgi:hypothetical protein